MKPVAYSGMLAVVLAVAAGAALPITAHAESPLKPKALVIMLDGFRGDAVENLGMTNLQKLIAGKWQPGYKCTWSLGASTIRDGTTESAPNHVAIATSNGRTVKREFHVGRENPRPIGITFG